MSSCPYGYQILVTYLITGPILRYIIKCFVVNVVAMRVHIHTYSRYMATVEPRRLDVVEAVYLLEQLHMWQSWVEIEHYSVAYFNRVAAFKEL